MQAFLLGLMMLLFTGMVQASAPVQRLQQLVDYVGVDYGGAVAGGKVVDATEYEEMLDFADTMLALSRGLPDSAYTPEIGARLKQLQDLVQAKADPARVSALSGDLRRLLIEGYGLSVTPREPPDLIRGSALYARNCTGCHGAKGQGNGLLAAEIDPSPTDFTDLQRYRERTVYGLYSTITHGVEGTAMASYADLPETDRWSLAFFVGQLAPAAAGDIEAPPGPGLNAEQLGKQGLTSLTPAQVEAEYGQRGARLMAYLRSHPRLVYGAETGSPLAFARRKLQESEQSYRAGEPRKAHDLAVTAYLEGFELVEGNLDAVDSRLRKEIEGAMTDYRGLLARGAAVDQVAQRSAQIQAMLEEAGQKLASTRLSPATAFTSALVILLREGLEAILVIAALAAFLLKTGRRDGLRYLYAGTGAAFLLGLLTWYVSSFVVTIGGAGRELTEGFAALFAALMLFYVGFWLHSKTGAAQWKAFIQGSIEKALSRGTLWGLSGLAFIAVYREMFETVLFYQALWMQTDKAGQGMVFTGFLVAAGLLVLLGWMLLRYSTRLPLRQFFSVTSIFMFLLAVVFAGKGIAALQEAGKLPLDAVDFPSIGLLGIYPNLQGLMVQLALVVMAAALLWKGSKGVRPQGRT